MGFGLDESQFSDEPVITEEVTEATEETAEESTEEVLEEVEETEEVTEEEESTEEVAEETTEEAPDTHEIIVDGEVKQVSMDELKKMAQLNQSSSQRFREAALIKKQAQDLISKLKTEPMSVLNKLGVNFDDLAQEAVWEKVQLNSMSEEEKAAYIANKEAKEKAKLYEEMKTKQEDEEKNKEVTNQKAYMEQQIIKGMEGTTLPKDPSQVAKIAQKALLYLEDGIQPDYSDVAKEVEEEYLQDIKYYSNKLTPDQLREALGPELIKKLREDAVAKAKVKPKIITKAIKDNKGAKKARTLSNVQAELRELYAD